MVSRLIDQCWFHKYTIAIHSDLEFLHIIYLIRYLSVSLEISRSFTLTSLVCCFKCWRQRLSDVGRYTVNAGQPTSLAVLGSLWSTESQHQKYQRRPKRYGTTSFAASTDLLAGPSTAPKTAVTESVAWCKGYFLSFLLSFIWRPLNYKKLLPWAELNKDMLTGMRSMKRLQTLCSSATALLIIKWCLQKPGWTSFWKLLSRCWCAGDPPLKAGTLKPLTGMQDTE